MTVSRYNGCKVNRRMTRALALAVAASAVGLSNAFDVCPLRLEGDRASHFAMSRKSKYIGLTPRFGAILEQMLASGEIRKIIAPSTDDTAGTARGRAAGGGQDK